MTEQQDFLQQFASALESFRGELLDTQRQLAQQLAETNRRLDDVRGGLPKGTAPEVAVHEGEHAENAAKKRIAELEHTVTDLKAEVAQLRSQEAWIIAANQDLSERIVTLRGIDKANLNALANCNEEIRNLRESLRESNERIEQLNDLTAEIEELRAVNAALQKTLDAVEHQIHAMDRQHRIVISSLAEGAARKMGELLIVAGLITQEQLDEALSAQKMREKRMLGEILVEKGTVREQEVAQAVACQLQLPLVRVHRQLVDADTARFIGREACHAHRCVPLRANGNRVVLAMANPRDKMAAFKIERKVGRPVAPVVAVPSEVSSAIAEVFCA